MYVWVITGMVIVWYVCPGQRTSFWNQFSFCHVLGVIRLAHKLLLLSHLTALLAFILLLFLFSFDRIFHSEKKTSEIELFN